MSQSALLCNVVIYAMLVDFLYFPMLCCAMPCYVMLCHEILRYTMLCHARQFNAMPCHVMLFQGILCHAMLSYVIMYFSMPFCTRFSLISLLTIFPFVRFRMEVSPVGLGPMQVEGVVSKEMTVVGVVTEEDKNRKGTRMLRVCEEEEMVALREEGVEEDTVVKNIIRNRLRLGNLQEAWLEYNCNRAVKFILSKVEVISNRMQLFKSRLRSRNISSNKKRSPIFGAF